VKAVHVEFAGDLYPAQRELGSHVGSNKHHLGELGLITHKWSSADLKSVHVELASHFRPAETEVDADVGAGKLNVRELGLAARE